MGATNSRSGSPPAAANPPGGGPNGNSYAETTAPIRSTLVEQLAFDLRADPDSHGPGPRTLERIADVHPEPWVAIRSGRYRMRKVPVRESRAYPLVEYARTGSSFTTLALDLDRDLSEADMVATVEGLDVPPPGWGVQSAESGHWHLIWPLARPVHRYPHARVGPLRYLSRIETWYLAALDADAGYSGVLTRQPEPINLLEVTATWWGPTGGYRLSDLARPIPKGWRMPTRRMRLDKLGWIGRNVDTFLEACRWAGRQANQARPVLAYVEEHNRHYAHPLPEIEERHIARSVERYRRRWIEHGWHRPDWIDRQANRGRRSGKARRAATAGRDQLILDLVAAGRSQRQIAGAVGVSRGTVENVIRRAPST